ncbi:transcriptional regulator, TetR family [Gracilibacillus orientalis]|uniref:Transcriptional regulator, TetR family n=1 Tax=Gracilibacillus orientalis TaxID=334253 RepID=A0A1I4P165_9BACI|nr:TetR/AcrR family transcriptional regulator [Gracilibacillus orientalis]SFM21267.1 transcriptional regulator, TetR family [Gracilibacillus orientalis]
MSAKGEKRQQILDAAYKVFSTKGFNSSSIKDIANEAGIAAGLIHYYFKSKEELLLTVQRDIQQSFHQQYQNNKDVDPANVLTEIKERVNNFPDWYRFRFELYALGLKDENLQSEVNHILNDGRESLASFLQEYIDKQEDTDALASILLACFDGIALQKLFDENFNMDNAYQMLQDIMVSYTKK